MRPEAAPARILVRAPNWVGDAVMATPALRALRAAHPNAEIAVEGPPRTGELLRGLPCFDEFLPDLSKSGSKLVARARSLASRRFDWAVLLPDSPRAAAAPFLARIPRRVGWARDPLRRLLLTESLDAPHARSRRAPVSMVERYLAVTRRLDCPDRGTELELAVEPEMEERARQRLAARGISPGTPLLVVSPGAGFGPSKRWPPERFAEACDGIQRETGLLPVLAPAPDEVAIAREVSERAHERIPCLDAPALSLGELKALVAASALVLTNDTGPRQIAVALGRPVVVVMGPTDPRHTAHHLERQRVLREEDVACSPCHLARCPVDHRCLAGLSAERAVAAARELLGRGIA